jgi:hypothetical protein
MSTITMKDGGKDWGEGPAVRAMSAMFTPYLDSESPSIPTSTDAYIPVRVTEAPRSDGSMLVYLPDGTAFVVNSRYLLRLDSAKRSAENDGKDPVADDDR